MSLDSVTRINDFFESEIETGQSIYTIYDDKNFSIEDDSGGGPWCRVKVESSFDDLSGLNPDLSCYAEEGLVIIKVYVDTGLGDIDLYALERIATLIRNSFRNVTIPQTGSEEGAILFKDMSARETVEEGSRYDQNYKVKRIMINYVKDYAVVVPPLYWLNDGTGGLSNPWNNAEFWSNR